MAGITIADLHKYFDLCKIFFQKCSSIDDCLFEATQSQRYLGELIELKAQNLRNKYTLRNQYEGKMAEYRSVVIDVMTKKGLKYTEKMVDAKAEVAFKNDIKLREDLEEAEMIEGLITDLIYTYMQRKSIITEMINHWKAKLEVESCIMNNKRFIEKVLSYGGK